jgi:hypothetical protein
VRARRLRDRISVSLFIFVSSRSPQPWPRPCPGEDKTEREGEREKRRCGNECGLRAGTRVLERAGTGWTRRVAPRALSLSLSLRTPCTLRPTSLPSTSSLMPKVLFCFERRNGVRERRRGESGAWREEGAWHGGLAGRLGTCGGPPYRLGGAGQRKLAGRPSAQPQGPAERRARRAREVGHRRHAQTPRPKNLRSLSRRPFSLSLFTRTLSIISFSSSSAFSRSILSSTICVTERERERENEKIRE